MDASELQAPRLVCFYCLLAADEPDPGDTDEQAWRSQPHQEIDRARAAAGSPHWTNGDLRTVYPNDTLTIADGYLICPTHDRIRRGAPKGSDL